MCGRMQCLQLFKHISKSDQDPEVCCCSMTMQLTLLPLGPHDNCNKLHYDRNQVTSKNAFEIYSILILGSFLAHMKLNTEQATH